METPRSLTLGLGALPRAMATPMYEGHTAPKSSWTSAVLSTSSARARAVRQSPAHREVTRLQMPCIDMVMGHQSLEGGGVLCKEPHAHPGQDRRWDQDFPGGLAGVSGFLRRTMLKEGGPITDGNPMHGAHDGFQTNAHCWPQLNLHFPSMVNAQFQACELSGSSQSDPAACP